MFFLSLEVELKTFRTEFSFNSRASFCAAVFGLGKLLITPAGWHLTQQIKAIPTIIIIIVFIFIFIMLQLLRPARVIRLISLAAISESQLVLLPQLIQEERSHRVLKTTNGTTFGFFFYYFNLKRWFARCRTCIMCLGKNKDNLWSRLKFSAESDQLLRSRFCEKIGKN